VEQLLNWQSANNERITANLGALHTFKAALKASLLDIIGQVYFDWQEAGLYSQVGLALKMIYSSNLKRLGLVLDLFCITLGKQKVSGRQQVYAVYLLNGNKHLSKFVTITNRKKNMKYRCSNFILARIKDRWLFLSHICL